MGTLADPDVEERLGHLERRLDVLDGETEPDARAAARRLADLERDLVGLEPSVALPAASRWRDLAAAAAAPGASAAADELLARLVEDSAAAWGLAHPPAEGPEDAFRALAAARAFDLDALGLRRARPPLADVRPRLQDALARAVAARPPEPATRDAWARDLLDHGNAVLSDADELPPERAQERLALVARDLDWHAAHVETRRGPRRARLLLKARRLSAEAQERELQHALERRFGAERVARFDRVVLWLIVLVLSLLAVELLVPLPPAVDLAFMIADTLACAVFLADVGVRFAMVRGRARWLLRHFLVDVLPSLPFALAIRVFRAIRLFRLARVFRVFGFLARGGDRLVRRHGHLLNRDVVLYPTREERRSARAAQDGPAARLRRLQARLHARWERLLGTAPRDAREEVARLRVGALEAARAEGLRIREPRPTTERREVLAEDLLDTLASLAPEEIEAAAGRDFVVRAARWVRVFGNPLAHWTPVLRRYVPRVSRSMGSAEVVAAAAHTVARELRRQLDRWLWLADLHGTVTPAELVDRVGTTMVKASIRPAYRLTLFGGVYLLVWALFQLSGIGFLAAVMHGVNQLLGPVLIVLGSACFGILGTGWWLRRIAGQATDFFQQSAVAQHLALTEAIKGRHVDRDAAILDRHVFAAERELRGEGPDGAADRERFTGAVRRWLVEAQAGDEARAGFDAIERAVLLYRDSLDGALLGDSDTRTTGQLLGSPALRNLRFLSGRYDRAERRAIQRLDLERQKSAFKGPYLWFSLMCRAVAQGAARLIVDYNRFALPLDQLDDASGRERAQYDEWLRAERVADVPSDEVLYVTTGFTALHFLDDDAARDREVELRFGASVLRRMQRDRRLLFRRIFGSYPLHQRSREDRVVNPYQLYQARFAGGRAFLLAFRLPWAALRAVGRSLGWVRLCVREIRNPSFQLDPAAARGADYATALRKIHRMRGPVAEAAALKRARFDPEYLGLRFAGTERTGIEEACAAADLRFLGAGPRFAADLEEERRRAARDLERLGRLIEEGLLERIARILDADPAHMGRAHRRAAAVAYVGDLDGVRRHLSCREILDEVHERAARKDALPWRLAAPRGLRRLFRRWWEERGRGDGAARRAAWRATQRNVDGAADALRAWAERGDAARDEGVRRLAGLLRHPERITDQLVTLRIVQTLSLLDVLHYREHVFRMGEYARDGDDPAGSLDLA